ncbi:MAG: peptidyl-prolyl cis-trans isomerase, peptidylprolyl isomerase [Parcubacteria group bacterium]|nr:peptidyl-prolyl cis-trans isomerase, peptidylprolyl isomerase [Parcubacteria group bacterium]
MTEHSYNTLVYVFLSLFLIGGGYWFYAYGMHMSGSRADGTASTSPVLAALSVSSTQPLNTQQAMQATFHTNKGDITIEFSSTTPGTVANFTKLAGSGFYDGVKFHRVIPGFMIQGGDPLSKDDAHPERWGTGGPGYTFKDEIGPGNSNAMGTIAMANAGPDTNGSQFFINLVDNNFLDDKHTVFGRVISGLDVVEAIGRMKTGASDRPVDPVIIESVTLK